MATLSGLTKLISTVVRLCGPLPSSRRAITAVLLGALALTGCAQPTPGAGGSQPGSGAPASDKTLVMFIRTEPAALAVRGFFQKGAGLFIPWRLFNAQAVVLDAAGQPLPELLTSVPQLNTQSWQVFPDGRMRTTYELRPNLTWHDGAPLTAEDFVFSYRVFSHPELGRANQPPMSSMTDATAPDPLHFVIDWHSLYPDANTISALDRELTPLPKHILGPAFDLVPTGNKDALYNHPFWSPQYVGAGPYKLDGKSPGESMDLARFDNYVLGRPKIARMQLRFTDDQNVVVAHMLAGEGHAAGDQALGQAGAATIQNEWNRTNGGSTVRLPSSWKYLGFQQRPEYTNPRAILDVRVRRAVFHTIEREPIVDVVVLGQGIISDTPVWSGSALGAAIDASLPKYPRDPRMAEALMNQAGYTRGPDGIFRGAEGRLSMEITATDSPTTASELLLLANQLQEFGFDMQQRTIPTSQSQSGEIRAKFPGTQVISTLMGEPGMGTITSEQIPTEANRWVGGNRGGYVHAEYDRLFDIFNSTLGHNERINLVRQMMRIYLDDASRVSMYFPVNPFMFVSAITGPTSVAPESRVAWNVHQWEFK